MFWNDSALNGYPIEAADGQIGTVAGLIYDPSDWTIRWLVADTGDWLPGRRVLLPVAALGQPDPEAHRLPVALTMRQAEDSPDVDPSEPLSQEMEVLLWDHYNLPRGLDATHQESHLHGISELTGDSIEATDGAIGHAEDFLIHTEGWRVRYLTVHASSWWTDEKRLISPLSIDWIDWARSIIHQDVTCQKVKDSPPYVAAETVDGAFEALFDAYYGIRWVGR